MGTESSRYLMWIFTGNRLWCKDIIWICGRNKRWEVGILIYMYLFFCNWRTSEAACPRGPSGTPFVLQGDLRVSGNILLMFQSISKPGTLLLNLPCNKPASGWSEEYKVISPFMRGESSWTLVMALSLSLSSYAWKLWFTKYFLTTSSHKIKDTRCWVSVEDFCKWNHGFWQLLNIELFFPLRIFYYLQWINWLTILCDEHRYPRLH